MPCQRRTPEKPDRRDGIFRKGLHLSNFTLHECNVAVRPQRQSALSPPHRSATRAHFFEVAQELRRRARIVALGGRRARCVGNRLSRARAASMRSWRWVSYESRLFRGQGTFVFAGDPFLGSLPDKADERPSSASS